MLELTNERRSVSEQCSCLVAVRDDGRTERRQPVRKWSVDNGNLASRRFGCHQTCESVLMNTRRWTVVSPLQATRSRRVGSMRWSLLLSRRVAHDVASVDVRLSARRGCASSLDHRPVTRLVVRGHGCDCIGPACSCGACRQVSVMVLLLSRRLTLVTAAVTACLSVGR
jgi:hypothetical protein